MCDQYIAGPGASKFWEWGPIPQSQWWLHLCQYRSYTEAVRVPTLELKDRSALYMGCHGCMGRQTRHSAV